MRLPWGGLETEAVGAWDRARRAGPRLATAPRSSATRSSRPRRAPRSAARWSRSATRRHRGPRRALGARPGPPDPGRVAGERQAPRARSATARSSTRSRTPSREGRIATWFWGVQEIPDILNRWGHDLPPERVHLVTVPPPGGPPNLLWERFSQAFGLTGLDLDLEAERANPSLGVPETALLRRINRRANHALEPAALPAAGPRAARPPDALAPHPAPRGSTLPPDVHPWAQELTGAWIDEIKRARVRRRRRPRRPGRAAVPTLPYADPDHPDESEVADAARRRDQGAAAGERAAAATPSSASRGELDETQPRPRAVLPAADLPLPREGRAPAAERRLGRPRAARRSTGGRGAGARGRRSAAAA